MLIRGHGQNGGMRGPRSSTAPPAGLTVTRLAAIAAAALCCASGVAWAQKHSGGEKGSTLYKWVDEDGVTHFGDAVPAQYADREKQVLNSQGVQVGTIAGRPTAEEAARLAAEKAAEDNARTTQMHDRERNQHLLATYLSVGEIESLRDRRVEILDGQARVTQQYLAHLREHEHLLLVQVQRFKPYSTLANAGPMPDRVAEDIVRTESDIVNQERNLDGKRQEALSVKEQFDSDIERFRQLKKVESELNRSVAR